MDKILKTMKPAMLKFMRSRYTETETQKRWDKTAKLYFKWLREEGDLGGKSNLMASNMMICYAVCALYEAVDRNFYGEDFNRFYFDVMSEKFSKLNKHLKSRHGKKCSVTVTLIESTSFRSPFAAEF